VILPDINLLIHAYDSESPLHAASRAWWEGLMNGQAPVGLAWATMLGFIRLTTHRQVMRHPLAAAAACAHVRAWLDRPSVAILTPGPRHAAILFGLIESLGTAGNLTTDAHLAALAIEHQAELHSTDADFTRFQGLRWRNPLVEPTAVTGR
jgi:toxin-antitoxin system PIN domain toxin